MMGLHTLEWKSVVGSAKYFSMAGLGAFIHDQVTSSTNQVHVSRLPSLLRLMQSLDQEMVLYEPWTAKDRNKARSALHTQRLESKAHKTQHLVICNKVASMLD
jgi:hypothetical protein